MSLSRLQRTIKRPAMVSGYGYWSGRDVRVEFRPAAAGTGIRFVRDDLGNAEQVPARIENRIDVGRRSNLRYAGVQVDMVEHILAALVGLQIDNCEIGVDQVEMPGCDGSSLAFVQALDAVGTVEQNCAVQRLVITEPISFADGDSWIKAQPDTTGKYSVHFELDYPHASVIGQQTISIEITPANFRRELAPCRTFVLQKEADEMIRQGLGQRVTPRDLLVFDDQGPVENVLRFQNECARHKALDVIGDMALTGCEIEGRIIAHRSSHQLNATLATELVNRFAPTRILRATA